MTMTTSANIANVVVPIGMVRRGGRLCPVGELKIKKKKSPIVSYAREGMIEIGKNRNLDEAYTVPIGKKGDNKWKIPSIGKVGSWRTIRGKRYFFPDDGSSPVPKIRGVENKVSGKNLYDDGKKNGVIKKISDFLSGKATIKDVKPKVDKNKKNKGNKFASDLSDKIDNMLKTKAAKENRKISSSLKKMKKAAKKGDKKGFEKANRSLEKIISKMEKKRKSR